MKKQGFLEGTIFTIAAFLFLAGSTAVSIFGQQNFTAKASPSNDEAASQVDAYLSQWDKKDMPGGAVAVVKDGQIIYKRAFGMANLDHGVPNTTSTLFNLASVAKPFTAASIALLAQQGKLSLDDDIRKYIPEMPKYDDPVTIRHLIHHISGVREYEALAFFSGQGNDRAYSHKAMLNMLARQKNTTFKPGSKYQYSNSGYFLLGTIVQRVSGKSLRAFAEENIFKPLGMKSVVADNRSEIVKNRAYGYKVGPDKSVTVRASLYDLVGDSNVLASVEDLHLWDQNFYEPKVGNKELIQLLTTPGTLNNGKKISYAFGLWRTEYRGLPVNEHSGNLTGYRAKIFSFPEQKFTVIAVTNSTAIYPANIVTKLADIYLAGQLKPEVPAQKKVPAPLPPAIALSEKEAQRYAGIYANAESGKVFTLSIKDGKLMNSGLLKDQAPITPVAENRFLLAAGPDVIELNPVTSSSGTIAEIKLTKGGMSESFVPVKPPLDSPQQVAEYAGTYYSEEFNTDYKITAQGNSLMLQISDDKEAPLTAAYADVFNMEIINLAFTRDDKGKVTGFVFTAGGERELKGITFKRR